MAPSAGLYEVRVASQVPSKQVLEMAAGYANLVVAGPGVLRRQANGGGKASVSLKTPEWVSERDVLIRFTYMSDGQKEVACGVRIRLGSSGADTWAWQAVGGEECWPKPASTT